MSYFSEVYESVIPFVPEQLVSAESRQRIRHIVNVLPKEYALRTFGFECPLTDACADADFLVSSDITMDGPSIMMRASAAGSEFDDSGFERVREFGAFWKELVSREKSDRTLLMNDVWLEYDLIDNPAKLPVPGIFFKPYVEQQNGEGTGHQDVIIDLVCQAYAAAKKQQLSRQLRDLLEKCLVADAAGNQTQKGIHVAMMLSRASEGLRLVLDFAAPGLLFSFLESVGWPGSFETLKPLVEKWYSMVDSVRMNVDIGEAFGMKLGFELTFNCRRDPLRESRWQALLDYLVETKLCCKSKMEGLLAYSGHGAYSGFERIMEESSENEVLNGACRMFLVRKLFHVKIVYDGTPALLAKGYLGVIPYFRQWDALK